MEIKVKLIIESPHIMNAIIALAEVIEKNNSKVVQVVEEPRKEEKVSEINKEEDRKVEIKEQEKHSEEVVEVTLEDVRKVLAEKSKAGKQEEVKSLIQKYGANRLTDIDTIHYKEILERAEVL